MGSMNLMNGEHAFHRPGTASVDGQVSVRKPTKDALCETLRTLTRVDGMFLMGCSWFGHDE